MFLTVFFRLYYFTILVGNYLERVKNDSQVNGKDHTYLQRVYTAIRSARDTLNINAVSVLCAALARVHPVHHPHTPRSEAEARRRRGERRKRAVEFSHF